jgi:hypothetical protein
MLTTCPSCQKKLKLDDNLQGKQVRCPVCKNVFRVEAPAPEITAVEPIPEAVQPRPAPRPAARAAPPPPIPAQDPFEMLEGAPARPAARRHGEPEPASDFEELAEASADLGRARRVAKRGASWLQMAFVFALIPYVIFAVFFFGLSSGGSGGRGGDSQEQRYGTALVLLMSVVYLVPVAFLAVGASLLANVKGRGLVITACILSFVVAPQLLIYAGIWGVAFLAALEFSTGIMILVPLLLALTCILGLAFSIIGGIRGLLTLGKPEVKAAYR